jgi:hypothetical protein
VLPCTLQHDPIQEHKGVRQVAPHRQAHRSISLAIFLAKGAFVSGRLSLRLMLNTRCENQVAANTATCDIVRQQACK